MGTESYRRVETRKDAEFIASDMGFRSYETVKLTPADRLEASTPLARLVAGGAVVPVTDGLVATPPTQTFAGFLVAAVEAGVPGERVLGSNLHRDGEVFANRIAWPVGDTAVETAAIEDAIREAADLRGLIFIDR